MGTQPVPSVATGKGCFATAAGADLKGGHRDPDGPHDAENTDGPLEENFAGFCVGSTLGATTTKHQSQLQTAARCAFIYA